MEYPALLSTVDCAGVVEFILRLKARVFSSNLYNAFCVKIICSSHCESTEINSGDSSVSKGTSDTTPQLKTCTCGVHECISALRDDIALDNGELYTSITL